MKRVQIGGGAAWPDPTETEALESVLRYVAQPTRAQILEAAAVLDAYRALCLEPRFRHVPVAIRRALKAPESKES